MTDASVQPPSAVDEVDGSLSPSPGDPFDAARSADAEEAAAAAPQPTSAEEEAAAPSRQSGQTNKAAKALTLPSTPAPAVSKVASGRRAGVGGEGGGAAAALPSNATSPPLPSGGTKSALFPSPPFPGAAKRTNHSSHDDEDGSSPASSRASKQTTRSTPIEEGPDLTRQGEEEESKEKGELGLGGAGGEARPLDDDDDEGEQAIAGAAQVNSTAPSVLSGADEADPPAKEGEEPSPIDSKGSRKAADSAKPTIGGQTAEEDGEADTKEELPLPPARLSPPISTDKPADQTKVRGRGSGGEGAGGKGTSAPAGKTDAAPLSTPTQKGVRGDGGEAGGGRISTVKSPPCVPSEVELSAVESVDGLPQPQLTVSIADADKAAATTCTPPSLYLVDVSPLPSFPSPYISTYRVNRSTPADEEGEGEAAASSSTPPQLHLGPQLLIPQLPYFVRVRAALATAAGQLTSVSEAVPSSPATLALPQTASDEQMGEATASAGVDHCAAVLTLRLSRGAKALSSRELSAAVRAELSSLLRLPADADAAVFQRLMSIERLASGSSQAKEEEVELTISPVQSSPSPVERQRSAMDWADAVEGQALVTVVDSAPSWLVAELLRSSLTNASGESHKGVATRLTQRITRVGPIRLHCRAGNDSSNTDDAGNLSSRGEGRRVGGAKEGASKAGSSDELFPGPDLSEPTAPTSLPTDSNEERSERTAPQPTDVWSASHGDEQQQQPGQSWDRGAGSDAQSPPAPPSAGDAIDSVPRRPPPSVPQSPRVSEDDYLPPARPPLDKADALIPEGDDDDAADLGAASRPYNPETLPSNELDDPLNTADGGAAAGEDELAYPATPQLSEKTAGTARDGESFSVLGWLLSHTLVAALLVAACMGLVVYAVFFRSSDSSDFTPLQSEEPDVERGDRGGRGSGGGYNAGAGPFAALQSTASSSSSAASSSSSGADSLSELDSEQQYHLALLKHSDTSSAGAVHFLEDVLTRLGIPSYGQSSFTAKLKDDYLSTIQQLASLDTNDWKRLNFPVVIEEAVRKALDDRKRLMAEEGGGTRIAASVAGSRGSGGGGRGGGLSLKPAAPKKPEKGGGGADRDKSAAAGGGGGGGGGGGERRGGVSSAEKKAVKKPLVAEAAEDDAGEEEEGWMDMDF